MRAKSILFAVLFGVSAFAFVEPVRAADVGQVWSESESGWQGVWTRRGNSNVFDAQWTHPSGARESAVLTITISGNNVSVFRDQGQKGTCNYSGVIRGNAIEGTYGCSWASGPYNWSATIRDLGAAPIPQGTSDVLGRIWKESEVSGWQGVWTRRGNSNVFDAEWTHPSGARESAVLTITISGNNVSVFRDQGQKGTCNYSGVIRGNAIEGTYGCSWASGPYNWSATIRDLGAAPIPQGTSDVLGRIWKESEVSGWQGVWTRRGNSNVFDAEWTHPSGARESAVLTITISGNNVSVFRDQGQKGTCNYSGVIRGNAIEGTYGCSWASGPFNWSATITD